MGYSANKYNKHLKKHAQKLRKNMTKAEVCLWKYTLSRRQMDGYTFNRQRPVLRYIADFFCSELKLIIEIDGITHHFDRVAENDIVRQQALEKAGFTVIRFSDSDILHDIDRISECIYSVIKDIEMKTE